MLDLDVVVATADRPDALDALLGDLATQADGGVRCVVVDQSAPEAAARNQRSCARHGATWIRQPRRDLPRARNRGIAAGAAPIVLFLDDDVRLCPGVLDGHRLAYGDPWVGGIAGRILERTVRPNVARTANHVGVDGRVRTRLDGLAPQPIATAKGAHMSFRRVALHAVGGFDPGFAGTAFLEDADLSTRVRRLGWRLRFEPRVTVFHRSAPTGGVRTREDGALWWRVHNTARFLSRHHPARLPLASLAFATIAIRRGGDLRELAGAWVEGLRSAGA